MPEFTTAFHCLLLLWILTATAMGGSIRHPWVAGSENSRIDDTLKGLLLLEELNCVACHEAPQSFQQASRKAPNLTDAADRINPHYLEAFIASPHTVRPGTTMPDMPGIRSDAERAEIAREITQFLLSLRKKPRESFAPIAHDPFLAEKGKALFHQVGCVACHSPRDDTGTELLAAKSVPLGALEEKYNLTGLIEFLRTPHRFRPAGRMPDLRLNGNDVEAIAHYLLENTKVPGHLYYKIYQGRVWEGLENEVTKKKAGLCDDFNWGQFEKLGNNSLVVFEGFLQLRAAGEYEFFVEWNGGALAVNGETLTELVPHHRRGVKKASGRSRLNAGWNAIVVRVFNMGNNPDFSLEMAGPGFARQAIPSDMLSISKRKIPSYQAYPIDASLAPEGRKNFIEFGCANCHTDLKLKAAPASALADLTSTQGCLSDKAKGHAEKNWPNFHLNDDQRKLLRIVLPSIEKIQLNAKQQLDKSLAGLNCIACHDRTGVGGIPEARQEYFTSDVEGLGNEGRIPPPLNLTGAKLRPQTLENVLLKGDRLRPYLHTRMPQFGQENVRHLMELFAQVDQMETIDLPQVPDMAIAKEAGRTMVGSEGFTCIACHDFNGQKSAVGGFELLSLPQRLQKNWYVHYMLNPAHFRPGIIMPAYWPHGTSLRQDILGGDSLQQIQAIWTYLEDGRQVKAPAGLSRQSPELRVADEAVIARGRGSSAGYRGIAVGYPNRVNLAFDSEQMNLKILWQGDFANADNGRFSVRGEKRIELDAGVPFHRLKNPDEPWPWKRKTDYLFPQSHGYQYRGYYLDKQKRPTFMYQYGEVTVEDFFEDVRRSDERAGFKRRLTFMAPKPPEAFIFRVATGKTIKQAADNEYQVDSLTIRSSRPAEVRAAEKQELLIPLELSGGQSTLEIDYIW